MKRFFCLVVILSIMLLTACGVQEITNQDQPQESINQIVQTNMEEKPVEFKSYTLNELQEDFDQVSSTILMQNPLTFTDREELTKIFDQQRLLLKDGMEELDLYRILMPAIVGIKCGHTGLNFSDAYAKFNQETPNYLPLDIKTINNKTYVVKDLMNNGIPGGSELVSINGRLIGEIIPNLISNTTADGDNQTRKYYILNHWFSGAYADYIEHADTFSIEYKESGNDTVLTKTLQGINKNDLDQKTSLPQAAPYSYEFIDSQYAKLIIQSFGFYDNKGRAEFEKFIDDFFAQVKEKGIGNLVLDLRDNWGGDPICSSYLFTYLIKVASPYFSEGTPYYSNLTVPMNANANNFGGNLYVLTNGVCFSSTGHLCALLKYYKLGAFIGQETGGSYLCTDGSKELILKNTLMKLHYSTQAYSVAVKDMTLGRGIVPDYNITPTIEDILAGTDLETAKAVDLIDQGK